MVPTECRLLTADLAEIAASTLSSLRSTPEHEGGGIIIGRGTFENYVRLPSSEPSHSSIQQQPTSSSSPDSSPVSPELPLRRNKRRRLNVVGEDDSSDGDVSKLVPTTSSNGRRFPDLEMKLPIVIFHGPRQLKNNNNDGSDDADKESCDLNEPDNESDKEEEEDSEPHDLNDTDDDDDDDESMFQEGQGLNDDAYDSSFIDDTDAEPPFDLNVDDSASEPDVYDNDEEEYDDDNMDDVDMSDIMPIAVVYDTDEVIVIDDD